MPIESYSFGRIVIDGKRYTGDVIISPEGDVFSWWRREGHKVHLEDVGKILKGKLEVLIFGTGYSGMMRVPDEVIDGLAASDMEVIVQKTKAACETFNELYRNKRVVAALHLTC